MISKEEFNKVWKDSSRESILNQFYYEHYELVKLMKIIHELQLNVRNFEKYILYKETILDMIQELKTKYDYKEE